MTWQFSPSYKPEDYPKFEYPTIVRGVVYAPKLRLESLDGSEMYLDLPDGKMSFKDYGPVMIDGKQWGVSHLQKYSTYGWLYAEPAAYHHWLFWRPQKKDASGSWMPGTEQGIYFRRPFSWRWDVASTMINGEPKHWIYCGGYLGGHWD